MTVERKSTKPPSPEQVARDVDEAIAYAEAPPAIRRGSFARHDLNFPEASPQRWRNESPGRRDQLSEADHHDLAIERRSMTPHDHRYETSPFNAAFQVCVFCGGWKDRIEGLV